jgi:glycosyltransferase involved in cell wall biosynthesis
MEAAVDWVPVWVTEIDLDTADDQGPLAPAGVLEALVLARRGAVVAGLTRVTIGPEGRVPLAGLPRTDTGSPVPETGVEPPADHPLVSVVLCTRARPDSLERALASLSALADERLEIVVVDNAPPDDRTRRVVERWAAVDARIRYVCEPRPGLSNARNAGGAATRGEILAYTDDDVTVDRWWVRWLAAPFADPAVGCVTGLVPPAELDTPTQQLFDRKVSWGSSCTPARHSLAAPGTDSALFPFTVGQLGAGANFALRRSTYEQVGRFDPALGAGSLTRGGEDLDYFLRVLLSGAVLAYEPSAVVWHFHRREPEALVAQYRGYGSGLSAFVVKHLVNPRTAWAMARRIPRALRLMRHRARAEVRAAVPAELRRAERRGLLEGPWRYGRGRLRTWSNGRRAERATATSSAG